MKYKVGIYNIIPNIFLRLASLNINQGKEIELFNAFTITAFDIRTRLTNKNIN